MPDYRKLSDHLGYTFRDEALLERALRQARTTMSVSSFSGMRC